jgi:hypothetical protein
MDTNSVKRLLDWLIKVLDVVLVLSAGAVIIFVVVFLVLR